ncbi:MAG: exosortase family protein XrtF [Cyclobacteriaceae bacterium]|jgi:exosortase family protein XrtF
MKKDFLSLVKENKSAIYFLFKFITFYLILNTFYGLYVEYYSLADPFTLWVSENIGWILSFFHDHISVSPSVTTKNVAIQLQGDTIINVFEGCNSINVGIVFIVFVAAFSSSFKYIFKFVITGLAIIYMMNLARVSALFWIALYFPNSLYFFHKFLFTAIIYGVVFILWYVWVKKVNRIESGAKQN